MPCKAGYRVQIALASQKQRADLPYKYQILKATVINLSSFPLVLGNVMQLWLEKIQKAFGSGQSGVHSGIPMAMHGMAGTRTTRGSTTH